MSETNEQTRAKHSGQEKRKRRTRNDEDGRNFTCHCGKSYLSYPALYTHIKTKHNGKAESLASLKQEVDSNDLYDQNEQTEKVDDAKTIESLKKFLIQFFPFGQREADGEEKKEEKKNKQANNGSETNEENQFITQIKSYWDKRRKQEEPRQNEAYSTPMNYVFGRFLFQFDKEVSPACRRYITDFILDLRNIVNELKGENGQDFCSNNSAANLPNLFNDVYSRLYSQTESIYTKHPTMFCKTIFHFARWIFYEKYTNLSLKFNAV